MYCGGPTSEWLPLVRATLGFSGVVPQWPQLEGGCRGRVFWTHQGRVAVALALKLWNVGSGDEVLVPAYNCGSEIDPILTAGATAIMYRINGAGCIDEADLYSRITPRTKVVYVTHYFGWPQKIAGLALLCRNRGIRLLEDCALSLFSADGDCPLGASGDAAVYSFPKTLGVPDGGALVFAGSTTESVVCRRPVMRRTLRCLMSLMKRRLRYSLPCFGGGVPLVSEQNAQLNNRGTGEFPDMPESYYFERATADWCISRATRALLPSVSPISVVSCRRDNFLTLQGEISRWLHFRCMFESMPPGVCPLGFPLLVARRRACLDHLAKAGIAAFPWWEGYHRGLDWAEYPEARQLKDHVLVLPVHQQLGPAHMRYIARVLRALPEEWVRTEPVNRTVPPTNIEAHAV